MAPTGYSVSVDLDVTILRETAKKEGINFFPCYLYLSTLICNRYQEFRIAYKDDILGYWDTLTPMYALFHPDDTTISLIWTSFDASFTKFYKNYLQDTERYAGVHGVLGKPDPPVNSYTVSTLPWVSFKSFSLQTQNPTYFFPSIEAGKYYKKDGKLLMPLSMTVSHATTDGYHIAKFLEEFQQEADNPKHWMFC